MDHFDIESDTDAPGGRSHSMAMEVMPASVRRVMLFTGISASERRWERHVAAVITVVAGVMNLFVLVRLGVMKYWLEQEEYNKRFLTLGPQVLARSCAYVTLDAIVSLCHLCFSKYALSRSPAGRTPLSEKSKRKLTKAAKVFVGIACFVHVYVAVLLMGGNIHGGGWRYQMMLGTSLWPRVCSSLLCVRDYSTLVDALRTFLACAKSSTKSCVHKDFEKLTAKIVAVTKFWNWFICATSVVDIINMSLCIQEIDDCIMTRCDVTDYGSIVVECPFILMSIFQLVSQVFICAEFNERVDKAPTSLLQSSSPDMKERPLVSDGEKEAAFLLHTCRPGTRLAGCVRITIRKLIAVVVSVIVTPYLKSLLRTPAHIHRAHMKTSAV